MQNQKKLTQKILDNCIKLIRVENNADVNFIVEKLAAHIEGKESMSLEAAIDKIKNLDELNLAINRKDYTALSLDYNKNLQKELLGKRSLSMNIVKDKGDTSQVQEFPKKLKDFLIFYKLLVNLCKLSIIKQDDIKLNKALEKCSEELEKNE
mmetsp:Transcript_3360/g.5618  ORF Transcript_3360/g.5618 Transcript_3360/m.5618 type:complete len:152 (-) Transcript_3360:1040-1495(-)